MCFREQKTTVVRSKPQNELSVTLISCASCSFLATCSSRAILALFSRLISSLVLLLLPLIHLAMIAGEHYLQLHSCEHHVEKAALSESCTLSFDIVLATNNTVCSSYSSFYAFSRNCEDDNINRILQQKRHLALTRSSDKLVAVRSC